MERHYVRVHDTPRCYVTPQPLRYDVYTHLYIRYKRSKSLISMLSTMTESVGSIYIYWVIQNDCGQVWQLCTKIYVATVWVE
jgi:hypothetical protein